MVKKKTYKRDFIFIAVLLAIGAVFGVILLLSGKKGNLVNVNVDGEVVKQFSLDKDTEYEIHGVGEGINCLVIEDGYAYLKEANCPDCLCVKMGKINKVGQSVVCLPNKVVVEIAAGEGSDVEPDVDFVAG